MRIALGRRSAVGLLATGAVARPSMAAETTAPITIGFAEALTGSLAARG